MWALAALALVLLGVLVGGLAAREALALREDLQRAEAEFDAAASVADPLLSDFGSFREAQAALATSSAHLTAASTALGSAQRRLDRLGPLLAVGARLPGWPRGLSEVEPLIASAQHLSSAGVTLSDAFTRLTERIDQQAAPGAEREPAGARLAAGLTDAEPDFRRAYEDIQRAIALRRSVDAAHLTGPLAPARGALDTFDRRIRPVQENVDLLVEMPPAARAVLGMDGRRTYAVLGQNSAELRPTGGFIGSLGIVTIENGATIGEDYRGSYTFDNPARGFEPMPPPLFVHLGGGGWTLRDSNWSPDFPTTAATVERMLMQQRDIRVDGVIAFNTYTVGMLLDVLGPIPVEGFEEPVSADTWYKLAEQLIYFQGPNPLDGERNKGKVLEPLLQAVISRVQNASSDELPKVVKALQGAVKERQLLVAFHDEAPQAMARRYGADGRFAPPTTGDVLGVVDANLSYSKVGPYIGERIEYDVWLNGRGVAQASRVTITYHNRVTPQQARDVTTRIYGAEWDAFKRELVEAPGIYGTYVRVYVPRNSRLLDASTGTRPGIVQDLGFTSFERYHRVPATTTQAFSYGYQIPADRAGNGQYRLMIIKQPGTAGHELVVRVHLPEGTSAEHNRPMEREGNTLVLRDRLLASVELEVRLK